jgi:hypothetical protein
MSKRNLMWYLLNKNNYEQLFKIQSQKTY